MLSIQALREKRAAKAQEVQALVAKEGNWTSDMQASYDALMGEVEALGDQIKRIEAANKLAVENAIEDVVLERAEKIAKDQRSPAAAAFVAWMRKGEAGLTAEQALLIKNAMSEGTNSQGGYTVETEIATSILEALKQFGGMRAVSSVIQTAMGNPMSFPTSDGTTEVGEIIPENTTATAADPVLGTIGLPVYKFSSKIIAVPFELLQDSNVDIEAFVRGRIAQRLGRITNTKFTVGSGTGEPNGVSTACVTGRTGVTGQTVTVIYDDLIELEHSVDPAYRALGNCRWMMHDSSIKVIRKIKDTTGRPLFTPGYEQGITPGEPNLLAGYPIQINQDVAVMAANAKSILFGDFSYYTIRDVMQMQLFRFTDSAYAKLGQVGFLAWMRAGGNFLDVGGSVKAYANSAT